MNSAPLEWLWLPPEVELTRLQEAATQHTRTIRTREDWLALLNVAARLPGLSTRNLLLAHLQQPDAARLATAEEWLAVGRQVLPRAPEMLLLPATSRGRRKGHLAVVAEAAVSQEKVRRVVDVAHTEPIEPAPADEHAAPAFPTLDLSVDQALTALSELAKSQGWTIQIGPHTAAELDTANSVIRLLGGLPAAEQTLALAHELAHLALLPKIPDKIREQDPDRAPPPAPACRGVWRVEADSAAYLVARAVGLNQEAERLSFPAPTSWAGRDPRSHPERAVYAATDRVRQAGTQLVDHLAAAARPPADASVRLAPAPAVPTEGAALAPTTTPTPEAPGPAADAETTPDAGPAEHPQHAALLQVHADAHAYFTSKLTPHTWAQGYLQERGIGAQIVADWGLGYAPDSWTGLTDHLRGLGYDDALLKLAGLARPTRNGNGRLIDTFRDRLVAPIRDRDGDVVAFIGRRPPHEDGRGEVAKYLNTSTTPIFGKGQHLFGLAEGREALAAGAIPVVVEGVFDAIAVSHAADQEFVGVATCGTALTEQQLAALAAYVPEGQLVVSGRDNPDLDAAGRKAALAGRELLQRLHPEPQQLMLPDGRKDPAEVWQADGAAVLAEHLRRHRRPLADLVVDDALLPWVGVEPTDTHRSLLATRQAAQAIYQLPPEQWARQVERAARQLRLEPYWVMDELAEAVPETSDFSPFFQPAAPAPALVRPTLSTSTSAKADRAPQRASAPGTPLALSASPHAAAVSPPAPSAEPPGTRNAPDGPPHPQADALHRVLARYGVFLPALGRRLGQLDFSSSAEYQRHLRTARAGIAGGAARVDALAARLAQAADHGYQPVHLFGPPRDLVVVAAWATALDEHLQTQPLHRADPDYRHGWSLYQDVRENVCRMITDGYRDVDPETVAARTQLPQVIDTAAQLANHGDPQVRRGIGDYARAEFQALPRVAALRTWLEHLGQQLAHLEEPPPATAQAVSAAAVPQAPEPSADAPFDLPADLVSLPAGIQLSRNQQARRFGRTVYDVTRDERAVGQLVQDGQRWRARPATGPASGIAHTTAQQALTELMAGGEPPSTSTGQATRHRAPSHPLADGENPVTAASPTTAAQPPVDRSSPGTAAHHPAAQAVVLAGGDFPVSGLHRSPPHPAQEAVDDRRHHASASRAVRLSVT